MINVDWKRAANRREQALFIALLFALMLGFLRSVYMPKVIEIRLVQSREQALQMERNVLRRFLEKTPDLVEASRKAGKNPKLSILEGKLETPFQDLTTLLPHLTDPGFLEGVRIQGLSFQNPAAEAGFTRTDFSLQTTGSFGETVAFLKRLEEFPALLQVRDLALSVGEQRGGDVQAELTCRFFKKNEGGVPS